ncbi:mitochondrial carrier [Rickenella mellea]|uniref:Mitochondrial carrier n=1 Tax=Rickenella mellea TaxID=50990 RepID=A0A4Y7QPS7_9AGAM|nr:mitochondrial carrier [Rickenella mellea]
MPKANSPFWLGGVAASMAVCFTHPLDVAKVRMQTLVKSTGNRNPTSFLSVLRLTLAESGFVSLYPGLTASLLRQMSYSLVRLGSYDEIKKRIVSPTPMQLILAAALAGGLGGLAGNPADILLVRMTTDSLRPPESKYQYRNAITGLVNLIRDEGVRGLFRGVGTNTFRAVLMNTSQVGSYDYFKTKLLRRRVPFLDYELRDNLVLHSTASCLAGTVATTICAPADVIKARLMSTSGKVNPLAILSKSIREEGPMFLLKGWTPAFMRLGPNTIIMFVLLEQLKQQWTIWNPSPRIA